MGSPSITKVQFAIPPLYQGVLTNTGVTLDKSKGILDGDYMHPSHVGDYPVLVRVKNDWGEDEEIVTLRLYDPYIPVLTATTINVAVGNTFSWSPTGSYITVGSAERVREVTWSVNNEELPEGVLFDSLTGSLAGSCSTIGQHPITLTCRTSCGVSQAVIILNVNSGAPQSITQGDVIYRYGQTYKLDYTVASDSAYVEWTVKPSGGTASIAADRIAKHYRKHASTNQLMGTYTAEFTSSTKHSDGSVTLKFTFTAKQVISSSSLTNHYGNKFDWNPVLRYTVNGSSITYSPTITVIGCQTTNWNTYSFRWEYED